MKPVAFLLALLVAGSLATPVLAQTSALRGHDTNAPIDVDAARIEVRDNDAQAVFSGAVKIRQGTLKLDADVVKVAYQRIGGGDPSIQRLDARGNVRLVSPSERASGRTAIYDVAAKMITMIGDVVLARGDSLLRGDRLAINLNTGRSTLDGRAGATTPGAAPGGRVSGRFVVPPRGQTP